MRLSIDEHLARLTLRELRTRMAGILAARDGIAPAAAVERADELTLGECARLCEGKPPHREPPAIEQADQPHGR